ncbi:hypothetical protein AN958_03284 [Leucoagaricus sp. SymC.cos]|nr:hypothetical protein AN958_03284 [Leucoagaricus sp. SymC.cos]
MPFTKLLLVGLDVSIFVIPPENGKMPLSCLLPHLIEQFLLMYLDRRVKTSNANRSNPRVSVEFIQPSVKSYHRL